jgi:hypothetical protein
MGQLLSLRPSDDELQAAWLAYDIARLHVEALYRDQASTSEQRMQAAVEANRLHGAFARLCRRAEV